MHGWASPAKTRLIQQVPTHNDWLRIVIYVDRVIRSSLCCVATRGPGTRRYGDWRIWRSAGIRRSGPVERALLAVRGRSRRAATGARLCRRDTALLQESA